jgi:hypothetical protein
MDPSDNSIPHVKGNEPKEQHQTIQKSKASPKRLEHLKKAREARKNAQESRRKQAETLKKIKENGYDLEELTRKTIKEKEEPLLQDTGI